MIKKIVMPLRADGKGPNVLAHAAALTRRFEAHLEILHCRKPDLESVARGLQVPSFLRRQVAEAAVAVADAEEESAHNLIRESLPTYGLTETANAIPGKATAFWREAEGKQIDVIKTYGRLSDLIVVAKPDRDRNLGANTLKSALFNTGRPTLMCPYNENPFSRGTLNVAVAWNGSLEATRAVAMTMDLMSAADQISIVTIGKEPYDGARAEDLVTYLAARDVNASLHRYERKSHAGREILAHAWEQDADILVMGAYGDSHERETLFGGNTQLIVDAADMPVVFVH